MHTAVKNKTFIVSLFIFMLAFPLAASAQTESLVLPEGRRCEVSGETYQCFSLEEMRTILIMEEELLFYRREYSRLAERLHLLDLANHHLELALSSAEEQRAIAEAEQARLFDKWKEENRLRLEAENSPNFRSWFGWGLASAEAVAIITIIVTSIVSK